VSNLLAGIAADTTEVEDTTSLAVIKIPENIDFDFNALINNLIYGKIRAKDVKGHILVRNGVLTLRETGMNILGGSIAMNADYDTRDSLKPFVKADLSLQSFGVKDAFNTFNTIQKLAPAAAGVDGRVNAKLSFQSLLGSDMMPVIRTISGGGKLQSDEVTVVTSAAFDQMKNLLKLGDNFTNVFKDLNVSFNLKDGRVYVSPFDTKVGNIKMNISGDQGLDQTMNYIIKTEIPRSELGSSVNSLVNSLSAQAAAFGIGFKPADIMKINVKISGVFGKPVVTPLFGSATGESSTGVVAPVKEVAKQAVDNAIDTGKDKLRQEAEAKGDELIREAEQQGNRLREEAAKGAETIRKEADSRAQKLIDDASSKGTVARLAAQKAADTLRKEADKRASQLEQEADAKADKLLEEAKAKKEELLNKI
jgi:vacuolar-type H+-ATPase subunit H